MAAPEFVPLRPVRGEKAYESPPRRPESWCPDRPGELVQTGRQPSGEGAFGFQGPDQGYALLLANSFRGKLGLAEGESEDDAIAGCTAIGLRRASTFGRAPVMHDLRLALELFGFLDETPDPDLVAFRRPLFDQISSPHYYFALRELVSSIPEETIRMSPNEVRARASQWRSLLGPLAA
jgi:hypothetical protein